MNTPTLGTYLRNGRIRAGYSEKDVSAYLGVPERDVQAWEEGTFSVLSLSTLKALIPLFQLDEQVVFELLLKYQLSRLEGKWNRLAGKESPSCD